jgi:hypothetical protein
MAWVLLVIAGVLEAGWAIGLKYTHGFTTPLPNDRRHHREHVPAGGERNEPKQPMARHFQDDAPPSTPAQIDERGQHGRTVRQGLAVRAIDLARALWRRYTRRQTAANYCDQWWHPYARSAALPPRAYGERRALCHRGPRVKREHKLRAASA